MTALHFAASSGYAGLVEVLLKDGCNTGKKTDQVGFCSRGSMQCQSVKPNHCRLYQEKDLMPANIRYRKQLGCCQLCYALFGLYAKLACFMKVFSFACCCSLADQLKLPACLPAYAQSNVGLSNRSLEVCTSMVTEQNTTALLLAAGFHSI